MAIVKLNSMFESLSGHIDTIVFYTYDGRVRMRQYVKPRTQNNKRRFAQNSGMQCAHGRGHAMRKGISGTRA